LTPSRVSDGCRRCRLGTSLDCFHGEVEQRKNPVHGLLLAAQNACSTRHSRPHVAPYTHTVRYGAPSCSSYSPLENANARDHGGERGLCDPATKPYSERLPAARAATRRGSMGALDGNCVLPVGLRSPISLVSLTKGRRGLQIASPAKWSLQIAVCGASTPVKSLP
jgi:hypothetical protein